MLCIPSTFAVVLVQLYNPTCYPPRAASLPHFVFVFVIPVPGPPLTYLLTLFTPRTVANTLIFACYFTHLPRIPPFAFDLLSPYHSCLHSVRTADFPSNPLSLGYVAKSTAL